MCRCKGERRDTDTNTLSLCHSRLVLLLLSAAICLQLGGRCNEDIDYSARNSPLCLPAANAAPRPRVLDIKTEQVILTQWTDRQTDARKEGGNEVAEDPKLYAWRHRQGEVLGELRGVCPRVWCLRGRGSSGKRVGAWAATRATAQRACCEQSWVQGEEEVVAQGPANKSSRVLFRSLQWSAGEWSGGSSG